MHFPHSKPDRRTNEDVFFAYYPRLLKWAVQITRNDRTAAEDLVHDFYLRVTRISRPIDEIEQLEQYLFRVLRNLYYARLRRAGRDPLNDLSIVDYDSVEQGLFAADRRELFFVRDHLRQVCRYACERKSTVRSASVLILRFFLGYYPSEVMKILQAGRSSVDMLLQVARNEARLSLKRPDAIRCIAPTGKPIVSFRPRGENTQQLFTELQEAIFSSTEGKCFDQAVIERRYAADAEQQGLTTQELSHLVSCRICLDRVNTILHLPLLAERSPEDGIDRDSASGSGGGSSSGIANIHKKQSPNGPSFRRLEHLARQLFEHRPNSLQVAVDGEVRASQKVSAEINELRLKLAHKEEPIFIEVLSEQGFCLAFLQVAEPVSMDGLEQVETASFSDDRSLVLTLSFAGEGPIVHVLYRDPVMAVAATVESDAKSATDDELADESGSVVGQSRKPIILRPFRWLGYQSKDLILRMIDRIKTFFTDDMNPMLATAMICAVASIIFFCLSLRNSSVMKADDLLQRATVSENAMLQSNMSGVVVQSVRIVTPASKMERTLYRDVQRKRRLKARDLSHEEAALRTELEASGIAWNDPLSAGSFRDWHDHVVMSRDVVKRPAKGLLTLVTTLAQGRIASESLTVREADFHPVARTVELRDAGAVEIAELSYSVLPWSSVNPDLFEPVADAASDLGKRVHAAILPHLPRSLNSAEIDEAELGARLVLSRLHLDANDRIELSRQPLGVHVQGVVEDDVEKRQLQAQLYMVPHVSTSILTVREMAARPSAVSDITSIQQSSATATSVPSALEKYFAEQGMDRTAAGVSVQEFVLSSFAVKRQSEQISDLLNRFASEKNLSDAARTELSELLIQHKAALLDALGREDRQLISLRLVPQSLVAAGNVQGASALPEIAERNFALCSELISESNASFHTAQQIAPQLADSIAQLRAVVLRISAAAQLPSPPSASIATANQNK